MKILLTAIITMVSLSAVAASSCRYIERSIMDTKDDLRELSWEDHEISRKLGSVTRELRQLQRQVDRAQNELRDAQSSLLKLRTDFYNSDSAISDLRAKVQRARSELLPLETEEQKLKQKYKAIKVNLLNSFKRIKARKKWKKAQEKANDKRSELSQYVNRLSYFENLVTNFDLLEDSALTRIEVAEDQLEDALSNDPEITRLKIRQNRLQDSSNRIFHKKSRLESRLRDQQEALKECREDS